MGIENSFRNILEKNLKKYLKKYLWKKYLQTFISIPRCYTILALWDQMQHFGFDKKRILGDLNKNIFLNPKGGPFGSEKTVFAVQGVILPKKIFCVFGSLSNMSKSGLRILVCLNFHMTHLSTPSNMRVVLLPMVQSLKYTSNIWSHWFLHYKSVYQAEFIMCNQYLHMATLISFWNCFKVQ